MQFTVLIALRCAHKDLTPTLFLSGFPLFSFTAFTPTAPPPCLPCVSLAGPLPPWCQAPAEGCIRDPQGGERFPYVCSHAPSGLELSAQSKSSPPPLCLVSLCLVGLDSPFFPSQAGPHEGLEINTEKAPSSRAQAQGSVCRQAGPRSRRTRDRPDPGGVRALWRPPLPLRRAQTGSEV